MNVFNISRKIESIPKLKSTIPLAFKMVFSNLVYIAIAAAVFTTFWIVFSVFDQLLFFSPVVTFYLPENKPFCDGMHRAINFKDDKN